MGRHIIRIKVSNMDKGFTAGVTLLILAPLDFPGPAGVAELVDAPDSKSGSGN